LSADKGRLKREINETIPFFSELIIRNFNQKIY